MTTGSTGSTFPRWQLAILLGTPLVIGIGYLVYKKSISLSEDTKEKAKKKKSSENVEEKTPSIDDEKSETDKDAAERKKKQAELEFEKLPPLSQAKVYKDEGNICFRRGKYDEAIIFYDKAIDKCPPENKLDLAIFYQNRAAAYEMLKKWNQVKADCTKSLQYNPRYTKAYFRRAKAHEQTKDFLECLDDATATCILEVFQNNNSIMFTDRILKITGENDAIEGMKIRVPVLPSKNFIKTYFHSFVTNPFSEKDVTGKELKGYARAKAAFETENYEDVIPACTEEIESSESESEFKNEAMLMRGTFHLLSGCFPEAQQDFDAIINNEEADVKLRIHALIKRGSLFIQTERKEEGFEDFEMAQKLDPNIPDVYHQRAQIYTLLNELDKALSDYEKTVKLAPQHAMAYVQKCYADYRLACVAKDQMKIMSVMNDFKNAVEKYPDCVECYSLLAQVLCDQGQYSQADSFFEKALKLSPDNAALYVHRGMNMLQWNGDVTKAVEYMNKSIEIDEKCEFAYETLGTIEVQRANLKRALELFEKAIIYAKSQTEMAHLCALRNAAIAQINATKMLGIDVGAITAAVSQSQI